jgi:hypothetical protein
MNMATFTNPVIRGFNPDPAVCVMPATATTLAQCFLSTSTFEFCPGAAIYHSRDLINWRLIGHALNRRSQIDMRTGEPGAGPWASALRYRVKEKRWYLTNVIFHRYRPTVDERIFPRGFMFIQTMSGMMPAGLSPSTLTTLDSIRICSGMMTARSICPRPCGWDSAPRG